MFAMARMKRVAGSATGTSRDVHLAMRNEATLILDEDRAMCQAIGEHTMPFLSGGLPAAARRAFRRSRRARISRAAARARSA